MTPCYLRLLLSRAQRFFTEGHKLLTVCSYLGPLAVPVRAPPLFSCLVELHKQLLYVSGWPSGLRRCVQVAVSPGGVGLNPTSDNIFFFPSKAYNLNQMVFYCYRKKSKQTTCLHMQSKAIDCKACPTSFSRSGFKVCPS